MHRIKLQDRTLPTYSLPEEILNTITHGIGILMGIVVLFLCLGKADSPLSKIGSAVYGISMIAVYTISTIYHALPPNHSKKVFQVIDHCTIYLLIAGTYTPILLSEFVDTVPFVGWSLLILQWGVGLIAISLNAIDLRQFRIFSYTAYIVIGWAIIFILPTAWNVIGKAGFLWLLAGGISYTVGAIAYGIGSKKPWFHSIFHVFVLLGSLLQFLSIYSFIL